MKKNIFTNFIKKTENSIGKKKPEILIGIGICGMISTVILAVSETPKALRIIEEEKKLQNVPKLKPSDTVRITWKCYIPAAITGGLSIGCLLGGNAEHLRRNAALAAAYNLSKTALTEYKEKVVETIGEEKAKEVSQKVAQDKVDKNPSNTSEVVIVGNGDCLFMDTVSKRYFKSNIEKIKEIRNELNRRMLSEMYISLTDLYTEIGLEPTSVSDDLGWNIQDGFIEISFDSAIASDGTPCITMEYLCGPKYDYTSLM